MGSGFITRSYSLLFLTSISLLFSLVGQRRCGAQTTPSTTTTCTTDPQSPAFEVAAIKPVARKDRGATSIGQYGQPHFTMRGVSLQLLLSFAFDIQPQNFLDAPHGLEDAVFDLQVTSENEIPLTYEALKPRMQELLKDRFCLKAHTGSKQVAGYALVVTHSGPKLKLASALGEAASGFITQNEVSGKGLDAGALASMLASPVGRPVQDRTGLTGKYTFALQFASASDSESTLPSIFIAIKEQLGLELKSSTVPVPTLTVERINLNPTAN